jgi:hypothetical protein
VLVALDVKRILEQLGIDFKRYEEWMAQPSSEDAGEPAGADERQRPPLYRLIRTGRVADGQRHNSRIRPVSDEHLGAAGI